MPTADGPATPGQPDKIDSLGLSVQDLDEQLAAKLGLENASGVVVTQVAPGSAAARQGLRTGTLIKEVNRQPVTNVNDFSRALAANQDADSILLLVQDRDRSRYVVLQQR